MLTRLQRDELKGIADVAFKKAGGNQACALISRIARVATFSDYVNVAIDDRSVPLDVAIDVDRYNLDRGGEPWLIRAAAGLLGFMLVKAPEAGAQVSDVQGLISSAKESTEAIAAGWAARADGVITAEEQAQVCREFDEAIVAMLAARAAFAAVETSPASTGPQNPSNPKVPA